MWYFSFLTIALSCTLAHSSEWTPPENPDPSVILEEACRDAKAKEYETALAKHVWFHENALSIQPSLYGVRLSFALMYWKKLGEDYPPALVKLKEIRNQARKNLVKGKNARDLFHDLASINKALNEQAATKEVFAFLDKKKPKIAKQVFDIAKPSLVQTKAYALFCKYVVPKDDFSQMVRSYRMDKKLAEDDDRFGPDHLDFANKSFANEVTTLVAILAVNDRKKESGEIAALAREEWDDQAFHANLEKALKGTVPKPWP